MPTHTFRLLFTPGYSSIQLRELNGHDELLMDEVGAKGALKLLAQIQTPASSSQSEVSVEKLVTADRDYLLAAVYQFTFGPHIQSVITCPACKKPADVEFSIEHLIRHALQNVHQESCDEFGFYKTTDDNLFRLPTGEDELALWGLDAEQAEQLLLERCLQQPIAEEKIAQVQECMEQIAPLLLAEIQAVCPECNHSHLARFDMQSFLLSKLKNERKRVAMEIHTIASAYRWSHQEILNLPRSIRKNYAALVGLE